MRTLITGGAGFIGRYFIELFQQRNIPFDVLDLVAPDFPVGDARCTVGDVRDPQAVRTALQGCDRVLHLAAAHHDFGIEHDTYFAVNETGSHILCDEMDRANIATCAFFSSVAIYGQAPEPHTEDAAKDPTHPYGGSKLAGERVFGSWVRKGGGRNALIVRPTITFGPRNFANMYSLIRQIDSGKFARVGKGDNVKSLSYVENIVKAAMHLWSLPIGNKGPSMRQDFDAFNFVEKPDLTSWEIAEQIYKSLNKKPWPFAVPLGLAVTAALPFDVVIKATGKNLPVSSMRIKKLFSTQTKFEADKLLATGWTSPISLRQGLDKMTKWYLAEGKGKPAIWRVPPAKVGDKPAFAKMGGKADAN
jgi:GlcNAc-P-P-Und epimerase